MRIMSFKENLKAELEYQGFQLKEFAEKCGISKNTLGNYLTGHNSLPTADTAVKIARALGVSVEYLVTGTNSSETQVSALPLKQRKIMEALSCFDDTDLDATLALTDTLKRRYPQKGLSQQHFLAKLNEIFAEKTTAGEKEVTITSGELHRLLGGYPGTNHRLPICCAAMRQVFDQSKDAVLHSPESGIGATLTIRYALPR